MAEQLKHFFNEQLVRSIADELRRAYPSLRKDRFVAACMKGLTDLELIARGWHIAEVMRAFLPHPFAAAADILIASLGPEAERTGELGMAPFRYLPHVLFVQKYGLEDFDPAMRAQYELTKRFSAESSIRAFLVHYPEATYERLQTWARDDNVHVRRLVSEGTRPRLPWAPRLRAFQDDPRPVIALLELLKDDAERYVQRSVANNLNDIAKDHPDLAVSVCREWLRDASPDRTWIVRHALRSLVKKGHRGALAVLGVGAKPQVDLSGACLVPASARIGEEIRFSFELLSTGKRLQELLVDYAVHFVKANGTARAKVFKLRKIALPPSGRVELGSAISLKDMTTRRHYPGRHQIDVLINGVPYPLGAFDLRAGAEPSRGQRRSAR
ncbi:DNA alkylation repair protein [Dongia deserti]|uniref:DNA alkylation repair protein n=1 Tax=Dongia deserti TaxID=2268030 RepID=UPI000E64F593|nr:DNA alkylation repair protein [Dongia deserti]